MLISKALIGGESCVRVKKKGNPWQMPSCSEHTFRMIPSSIFKKQSSANKVSSHTSWFLFVTPIKSLSPLWDLGSSDSFFQLGPSSVYTFCWINWLTENMERNHFFMTLFLSSAAPTPACEAVVFVLGTALRAIIETSGWKDRLHFWLQQIVKLFQFLK